MGIVNFSVRKAKVQFRHIINNALLKLQINGQFYLDASVNNTFTIY